MKWGILLIALGLWGQQALMSARAAAAHSRRYTVETPRRLVAPGVSSVGSAPATPAARTRPTLDQGGDRCDDAAVIDTLPYLGSGTTIGFADDVGFDCPFSSREAPDVYYTLTPDSPVVVDIGLCESSFDTKLYILIGTCGDTLIDCDDDGCINGGGTQNASRLDSVVLAAGVQYFVVIDGVESEGGEYVLQITVRPPPPTCVSSPESCLGSALEHEPNSDCGVAIDSAGLTGGVSLAGTICPIGDRDYFTWSVPTATRATLQIYGASDSSCTTQPATTAVTLLDPPGCTDLTGGQPPSPYGWVVDGPMELTVGVAAAMSGGSGEYRLAVSEVALDTCRRACDSALVLPPDSTVTLNTCGGCLYYAGTPELDCDGPQWISGPQRFARFVVTAPGLYCFLVSGDTTDFGGDVQFKLFTDCADPAGSCVYSHDVNYVGAEITGPYYTEQGCDSLPTGSYFIGVSAYDEFVNGTTCGRIGLQLHAAAVSVPCDSVMDLRMVNELAVGVRLFWTAHQAGDYQIYSTSVLSNDGDPDAGADPDWDLVSTVALAAGPAGYTDTRSLLGFRHYVVTFRCP